MLGVGCWMLDVGLVTARILLLVLVIGSQKARFLKLCQDSVVHVFKLIFTGIRVNMGACHALEFGNVSEEFPYGWDPLIRAVHHPLSFYNLLR